MMPATELCYTRIRVGQCSGCEWLDFRRAFEFKETTNVILSTEQKSDFLHRGFSRRSFGRLATLFAAGSTLPLHEFAYAQLAIDGRKLPPGAVKIDSNENPL